MSDHDQLFRFVFENTNMRGELVHLDASYRTALEAHGYPTPVGRLLGEAIAASVLLGATIKFNGSLNLQLQGSGPVRLLLVQLSSERTYRAMAEWDTDAGLDQGDWSFSQLMQDGRLAITIEPEDSGDRYQGIIELSADSLSGVIEDYFQRSEQLQTRLWLCANQQSAAGLLIQLMPALEAGVDAVPVTDSSEDWNRVTQLSNTVTTKELLDLPAREMIHRLYNEEDVRLFESENFSFRCKCSRPGIENMLLSLGEDEVRDILKQEKVVSVLCEFCKHDYRLDAVDVEKLFAEGVSPDIPKTRH